MVKERTADDVVQAILSGDGRIAVWGTGFIGFSTMAHFANEGIESVGYDIDEDQVTTINRGEVPVETLKYWLGFDVEELVKEGLLYAETDYEKLISDDVYAHFIAIPTEKDGEPWEKPLEDVLEKIVQMKTGTRDHPAIVVVESTLTPGMSEDVGLPILRNSPLKLGEDVLFAVAPRRDWFTATDKKLPDVPRVVGGRSDKAEEHLLSILGLVCDNLTIASDHTHAEMVKSVENAYRHMGIGLANQLTRAYPDKNIREVLELAATKWNIPAYFPSVGVGGYCIPLASQYVRSGAENTTELDILEKVIETDREQPRIVADSLVDRGMESVAILGLTYKGDVKVDVLSPTIPIAERLQEYGVRVSVHDPYYGDEYIEARTGATAISFPDELPDHEAVVVAAGHRQYNYTQNDIILRYMQDASLVIDNTTLWEDVPFENHGIEYFYTGAEGWLGE